MNDKEYFEKRFETYGDDVRALAWSTWESQRSRFEAMVSLFNNSGGFSVLDIGCGFGDFLVFLRQRFHRFQYCGIDIVPKFINLAKEKFHDEDFRLLNILTDPVEPFDYVVASGIFNRKIDKWHEHTMEVVEKMFEICTIGIGVNFLSQFADRQHDNAHYVNPVKAFEHALKLSTKAAIRHDYKVNDFTVMIYK